MPCDVNSLSVPGLPQSHRGVRIPGIPQSLTFLMTPRDALEPVRWFRRFPPDNSRQMHWALRVTQRVEAFENRTHRKHEVSGCSSCKWLGAIARLVVDPGSAGVGKKYARKSTKLQANRRLYGASLPNPKLSDAK